jgi:hypothetical protein
MSPSPLVVTGVAPHSLGEELVRVYLAKCSGATAIGIDRMPNPHLRCLPGYLEIIEDLNPLNYAGGLDSFSSSLNLRLNSALKQLGSISIDCLVQCTGVYDSGPFLEHDGTRRGETVGVNLLGHIEVLHAVMSLNASHGFRNADCLTYIEVGSFQGLYPRAGRSLYATSKSAGIDFCTSLIEGKEIARCIYFAPAMIDTHMLHRNHWIHKSHGSSHFFDLVLRGSPDLYRALFRECNEAVLEDLVEQLGARAELDVGEIRSQFGTYCAFRRDAANSEVGLLSPEECAQFLIRVMDEQDIHHSGVYFASRQARGQATVRYITFLQLSRRKLIEERGETLAEGFR